MYKIQLYFIICVLAAGCGINATDEESESQDGRAEDKVKQVFDQTSEQYGVFFVWVPPGKKMVGTNNSQADLHETPQVLFELNRGFYIGRSEVTADQYLTIVPSAKGLYAEGQQPVRVKWSDAKEFCNKLNRLRIKEGHKKGVFRLPFEFEWEYIATYGRPINDDWWPTHSRYPDKLLAEYENYDLYYDSPHSNKTNNVNEVKKLKPNPVGVYDILGNVSEWCEGPFAKDVASMIDMDHEIENTDEGQKPIRGGDYLDSISELRPSIRRSRRDHHVAGFRILFDPYSNLIESPVD
jgi:formylglycine-generating enzyme required for sulfatase activity